MIHNFDQNSKKKIKAKHLMLIFVKFGNFLSLKNSLENHLNLKGSTDPSRQRGSKKLKKLFHLMTSYEKNYA